MATFDKSSSLFPMMPWREIVRLTPVGLVRKVRRSIGFRLLRAVNQRRCDQFKRASPKQYRKIFSEHQLRGVHVHSLCGANQRYEQVLSILSFLRHTGIPESWTIASDGSLTSEMKEVLAGLHPCIRILPWENFITEQNRACVERYAPLNPMGKKLAIVTNLRSACTSLYIDTDILFFPGAFHLRNLALGAKDNFYMEDWARTFSLGIVTEDEKQLPSVNAGFLVQAKPLAWDDPLGRMLRILDQQPDLSQKIQNDYCLEQTIVHIAYHASGARMLDRTLYVLESGDAWKLRDHFDRPDRVLRHYLSFVRTKFWSEAAHYLSKPEIHRPGTKT